MKLLLLKILLQRRAREEGFILPVVIVLGLVMVLLGAVNILGAGEENLNALSDNQKNKALAIAEVGVARYRQLLDRNRMLTVYSSDNWSSVTNTCDLSTTIANAADKTEWQPVKVGADTIGQYRLVSYIYDIDDSRDADKNLLADNDNQFAPNDDNINIEDLITFNGIDADGDGVIDNPALVYNPRGILKIQSKAADGSKAQVEVEIPIRINENDMDNLSPALWIGDGNLASLGNVILDGSRSIERTGSRDTNVDATDDNGNGNIVVSKPANGSDPGCDEPDISGSSNNNRVVYDPRPLPGIIPDQTDPSYVNDLNGDVSSDSRSGSFRGEKNQLETMVLLGAKEDPSIPTASKKHKIWNNISSTNTNIPISRRSKFDYYFYKISNDLSIDAGEKVATDGQSRVILYVDNAKIDLNKDASLQVGSKFARGYKSVGLQIYVNGSEPINIDPGGGTVKIKGLIHAPQSTLNITGSGNVLIEGAVWVNSWNNSGGANVTIIPDNAGVGTDRAYQHYLGTDNRAARPITNAPTDWEIQEVKDN